MDVVNNLALKLVLYFTTLKYLLENGLLLYILITAHKKGISSHQLARDIKVTQKTAWFILQRIRETYIGGKERNKHRIKRTPDTQRRSIKTKTPVLGILQRNGKVYAIPVKNTKDATILPIIRDKVECGSNVYTDEYRPYRALSKDFNHGLVNHSAEQYVSGTVHTNNIENFWSLLKRGLDGIYHHVNDKHLERYVNEFTFRYNNRNISEGSKFDIAIANGVNKRLNYKRLIDA